MQETVRYIAVTNLLEKGTILQLSTDERVKYRYSWQANLWYLRPHQKVTPDCTVFDYLSLGNQALQSIKFSLFQGENKQIIPYVFIYLFFKKPLHFSALVFSFHLTHSLVYIKQDPFFPDEVFPAERAYYHGTEQQKCFRRALVRSRSKHLQSTSRRSERLFGESLFRVVVILPFHLMEQQKKK